MIEYKGKEYDVVNENFLDIQFGIDEDGNEVETVSILTEKEVLDRIDTVYNNVLSTLRNVVQSELYTKSWSKNRLKFKMPILLSINSPLVKREEALIRGTLTSDGKFWFNKEAFMMFVALVNNTPTNSKVKWKDAKGNIVEITLAKAKKYVAEGIAVMQYVYGIKD